MSGGSDKVSPVTANDPRNWRNEPVRVFPHDPAWAGRFAEEAELLQATIGGWITRYVNRASAVPRYLVAAR